MAESLPELGATGLVINLYEYLWTKNNLLQTRCMYHKCPPVLVPDTILLKNKQPISWYFSSLKTGSLQRRTKDLTIQKVAEAIIRRQDPSTDIVSVYVGAAKGDVQPITEYLSPAGMDYFLSTPPSRRTKQGMMQSFVLPKGTSNFIIRVNWSPSECSMDSCININKLSDPELDSQDRAATNDDKNCVLIPMSGNVLATQLERLCGCIAEHVHLASAQQFKVSSMILNFKIDSEDRVWLLWCEQLEVADDMGRIVQGGKVDSRMHQEVSDAEEDTGTFEKSSKQRGKSKDKERRRRDSPKKGRDKYAEPEVVDSDDDDFFSAHESNLDDESVRGRSRKGRTGTASSHRTDDDDDEEGFPSISRPISQGSDADDLILLPESGRKGSSKKTPMRRGTSGSNASSDASSMDGRGGKSSKDDRRAQERQRELRKTMQEEKKRREEAEKKAAEAEERLKKAEAKAKAAEQRLKKAQQVAKQQQAQPDAAAAAASAKAAPAAQRTKRTVPDGTLPKIHGPPTSRPTSTSSSVASRVQQEALQPVDAEDAESRREKAESVNVMAEEVVKAAEDADAEVDMTALDEVKADPEDATTGDQWVDELRPEVKQPKFVDEGEVAAARDAEGDDASVVSEGAGEGGEGGGDGEEEGGEGGEEGVEEGGEAEADGDVIADTPTPAAIDLVLGGKKKHLGDGEEDVEEGDEGEQEEAAAAAAAGPSKQSAFEDDEEEYEVVAAQVREEAAAPAAADAPETAASASGDGGEGGAGGEGSDDGRDYGEDEDEGDYEDKPITNAGALKADAPKEKGPEDSGPKRPASKDSGGDGDGSRPSTSATGDGRVQFTVEVAGGREFAPEPTGLLAAAKMPEPMVDSRREEWETKGGKYIQDAEPSPAVVGGGGYRDIGKGPDAEPLDRNWEGDEVERDDRMINQEGAMAFRSELRVGTGFEKWSAVGISTVLDGVRVGSTATVFGVGETGVSVSSMFDKDGLQPPHMRALVEGEVQMSADGETDSSQRCKEDPEVTKAVPDPVPDFFSPEEESEQSLDKYGANNHASLPVRKTKGGSEKRRDTSVEMMFTPMGKAMDPDEPEDIVQMKADLGLPDALWAHEAYRSQKYDPGADQELMREARESRLIERAERVKGDSQSHIDTASSFGEEGTVDRGYAPEVPKSYGENARSLEDGARETADVNVVKNSEWAFDEYLRPEARTVNKSKPGPVADDDELSEVMEMKFDVTFANEEERMEFAKAQREKLAKLLGVPVHYVDITDVKPGSPVTVVRFNIRASDAAMIPSATKAGDDGAEAAEADDGGEPFDMPTLAVTMTETGGEAGHLQLSQKLTSSLSRYNIKVEDKAVVTEQFKTAPEDALDATSSYQREGQAQPRQESLGRTKGECDLSVPGVRFEEPQQLAIYSGDHNEKVESLVKEKGTKSSTDDDNVDRVYRPGREMMSDDQFSSAKVQRRPPKPAKRLNEIPLSHMNDVEEQVKVPYEEVDNTRRLKEMEDELNFLPAQRAAQGPRTAILAKKDEGLEDLRFDRLDEHDQRMEEKNKEEASRQPSLKLTKAVEETEYELAQKITGVEDPRTSVPCEPAGLSTGDRRQKKKGKEGEKLHIAAIPEAYMAFGTEGESQRLAPSVVTLEKPGSKLDDEMAKAAADGKPVPELLANSVPDLLQLKFDISFVDEKARAQYADAQRLKLAKLLGIPEDCVRVRTAIPGSPITVVTFEITPGIIRRSAEDSTLVHVARPFDNAVLDVGVTSVQDEVAEAMMGKLQTIIGPKVPISRMSVVAGKGGAPMKDRNVKFGGGGQEQVPAYLRDKGEMEERAKRGGALVSEKEAVEAGADERDAATKQMDRERGMESNIDEAKPVLAYDRRLPKNAKNKQHLLSRIHTIESTLQRLYGKLETDNELPDIESIESIMSNTIKQSVYQQDPGVQMDPPRGTAAAAQAPVAAGGKAAPSPIKGMGGSSAHLGGGYDDEDAEDHHEEGEEGEEEGEEGGGGVNDVERRAQLRAERRKRMEERERERAEKAMLDTKPKGGASGMQSSTQQSVRFGHEEEEEEDPIEAQMKGPDLDKLKKLQSGDDDDLALHPPNIPSVEDKGYDEAERARAKHKALDDMASGDIPTPAKPRKKDRAESPDDLGLTAEDLRDGGADESSQWKSAFSKTRHGKRNEIISLLDAGCPVELKDPAGNSLLNIAAQNGHKSIIKMLLRRGAALNTQNHKGQTPLHFCFTYGFTDLGNYLVSKGADDTVQNFAGLTCYEGLGD